MRLRFALSGLAFTLLLGAGCTQSRDDLTPSHAVAIQDSVRAALANFRQYSATAQWDSLIQLYTTDSSFRWIEEGTRYHSAEMRKGLASVAPGVRVVTTYDSVDVDALAPGLATLTTYYKTEFVGSTAPVRFGGAISMVWAHEPAGWRIREGHSSSGGRRIDRN